MHGEDYVCLGFLFGKNFRVAYISDVSRFLPTTVSCECYLYPSDVWGLIFDHCESYPLIQGTEYFIESLDLRIAEASWPSSHCDGNVYIL